ncbi:hypothetical protein LIS90_12225 [Flavobacterium psychrophilum]|uniref:cupin domain-containing protein n=1 Tax=Flavobacterium psychrophilum TaxID=96345 RepID=UPI001D063927|nr:hypothetical protein [Flavobacterium psychrophilum]MCB6232014.1 hypothetical protein [Flavobacterium psychrophilum]
MEKSEIKIGEIGTKVLFETEHVKVWDLTLAPGEATEWHQHQMDYMFIVIKNGKVATEYITGEVENQNDEIGIVDFRKQDVPHRLVNNDNKEYKNIVVEFKATFKEN